MDRVQVLPRDCVRTSYTHISELGETANILRAQLDISRFEYEADGNETTMHEYMLALKRFTNFVCAGTITSDLKATKRISKKRLSRAWDTTHLSMSLIIELALPRHESCFRHPRSEQTQSCKPGGDWAIGKAKKRRTVNAGL